VGDGVRFHRSRVAPVSRFRHTHKRETGVGAAAIIDPLTSSMTNLTPQQRHALKLLADAGLRGMPEALLLMNDVSPTITAALIASGLAKAATESIRAGDCKIEVPRVAITEAGRVALTARN
jgi:hypothetical protein